MMGGFFFYSHWQRWQRLRGAEGAGVCQSSDSLVYDWHLGFYRVSRFCHFVCQSIHFYLICEVPWVCLFVKDPSWRQCGAFRRSHSICWCLFIKAAESRIHSRVQGGELPALWSHPSPWVRPSETQREAVIIMAPLYAFRLHSSDITRSFYLSNLQRVGVVI